MSHLWQLSGAVVLRPEAFGGMAFHRRRGITLELDAEAYRFLCACRVPTSLPPADHPAARLIPQLVRLGFVEEKVGAAAAAVCSPDTSPDDGPVSLPIASDTVTLSAPEVVHLAITARCNQHCAGCYVPRAWGDELTPEEWQPLIDQWTRMRVFQIAVGGGEPLLYDGLFEVLGYARDHGIVPNLTTNGTLVDAQVVDKLARAGVAQVNVSWNGPTAAAGHAHPAAARALSLLLDASLRAGVNLLVTPALLDHLPQVLARLSALGVPQITLLRPKPPAKIDAVWYEAHRLRRADLIRLRRILSAWQDALKLHIDSALVGLMSGVHPARLRQRGVYGCAAGRRICTVWPGGQVTPCSFLADLVAGNAREMPFDELWARGQGWESLRDSAIALRGRCAGCAAAAQCGGARCIARYEQGDLWGGDDDCPDCLDAVGG